MFLEEMDMNIDPVGYSFFSNILSQCDMFLSQHFVLTEILVRIYLHHLWKGAP